MKKFFYVSGLPRSGSTLLMNILGQHSEVHITPTSGCHEVLWTTRNNWMTFQEHQNDRNASSPKNLQRVLNSILNNYHDTDKSFIIDKHRSWIHSIELLEFAQNEKAKIIVPVRDVVDILASFEKLYRSNAHLQRTPGDFLNSQTTEGRCMHWISNQGELGIAYNRLKDAFRRGYSDRMLLVEYSELTTMPTQTLNKIWNFLEMSPPIHDFDNIKQITKEDDTLSIYGETLHKIKPKLEMNLSDSIKILGKEIPHRYKYQEFWRNY